MREGIKDKLKRNATVNANTRERKFFYFRFHEFRIIKIRKVKSTLRLSELFVSFINIEFSWNSPVINI